MLPYLQNLFQALDFASMWDALLRVAAIFLCLTVHESCHGLAALALGERYHVDLPIISQVNQVLFEGKSAKDAVMDLMLRDKNMEVAWE